MSRELSLELCDAPEGRDGRWGGGRSRREGMCTHMADSLCCTVEANTTLQSNYTPIKIKYQFLKRGFHLSFLKPHLKGSISSALNHLSSDWQTLAALTDAVITPEQV